MASSPNALPSTRYQPYGRHIHRAHGISVTTPCRPRVSPADIGEQPGGEPTLPLHQPPAKCPSRTMTCMIDLDSSIMQAPSICPSPQAVSRHLLAKPPRRQPPLSASVHMHRASLGKVMTPRAYTITRRLIRPRSRLFIQRCDIAKQTAADLTCSSMRHPNCTKFTSSFWSVGASNNAYWESWNALLPLIRMSHDASMYATPASSVGVSLSTPIGRT
jgi:hypothetical protein